jgi:hypothetical protein
MLRHPEWAAWSDRKIAEAVKVDHKTVGATRRELTGEFPTRKSVGGETPKRSSKPDGSGSLLNDVLRTVSDEALIGECRRRGLTVEAADV